MGQCDAREPTSSMMLPNTINTSTPIWLQQSIHGTVDEKSFTSLTKNTSTKSFVSLSGGKSTNMTIKRDLGK